MKNNTITNKPKVIKQSLHLGDLHLGISQDSEWHQNLQRELIDQALEYSIENGITEWISYGDVFDVRKAITHKTMEFSREIIENLIKNNINITIIVGNHDLHFRNKIHPNAVTELLGKYSNVTVVDKPMTLDHDFVKIDLFPWMCEENTSLILDFIKNTSSEMAIGHFELNGFFFYKGVKSTGIDSNFLSKYKQVYSGHFHTISESGNIKYIGTPYSLTAGDENDIRGFYHLTDQGFKFIQNNTTWHQKLYYPDDKDINPEDLKNCSVRVFIKETDKDFDKFQTALEKSVNSLRFVSTIKKETDKETEQSELKTTLGLFTDEINKMDIDQETKDQLLVITSDLYKEANQ